MPPLLRFKRTMRSRHQDGHVYERGKRRVWVGSYFVYIKDEAGKPRRKHRTVVLGEKSSMRKWEAEDKLRGVIAQDNPSAARPNTDMTFGWFVDNRFLPMKSKTWAPATDKGNRYDIEHYLRPSLGDKVLSTIDAFACQETLNKLAEDKYSKWILKRVRVTMKAILEVAVDLDYLRKNPAKRLECPNVEESAKPTIEAATLRTILEGLQDPRDRAILMLGVFCAMRTSEVFGLKWSALDGDMLRVRSVAWQGKLYDLRAKTKQSRAPIYVPAVVRLEIEKWRKASGDPASESLMFPSAAGTPMEVKNWMRDRIEPVISKLNIADRVTFQILRRSFATRNQKRGTMKDVQTHLRHSSIETTADVYMQAIPASVAAMLEADAKDVLGKRRRVQ